MLLKANHVTLLRLVFLPIPCILLFGEVWQKSLALILFVAVGLTDYLDGYLARKQGPTALGALMDPMADKIFVTAMFVPLARMGVVPLWMLFLVFVREYAITELRSIHGSRGIHFQTSEMAKYKTTIQMIGGSVIILNEIFGSSWTVLIPLGGFFLFTLALAARTYAAHGRLGMRSITFVVLVAWGFVMRCFFPYTTTNWAIMALVVGVTMLSGVQYAVQTWQHMGGYLKDRFGVVQWASLAGMSVAFPAIFLSALRWDGVATGIIIAILSVEFVTGGLYNFLTTGKGSTDYFPPKTKTILLNSAGLLGLLLVVTQAPGAGANGVFSLALVASLASCGRVCYLHRGVLTRISGPSG
jgi:CDP-diacylglycerol--glycerol-3-phosphate 3-phosphatidyltransferase